jgi:hypothetical protein
MWPLGSIESIAGLNLAGGTEGGVEVVVNEVTEAEQVAVTEAVLVAESLTNTEALRVPLAVNVAATDVLVTPPMPSPVQRLV